MSKDDFDTLAGADVPQVEPVQQSEEIRSIRQELRRELQRVNQQLSRRDSELAEKNRQLSELDKQLAQKSKQLAQKSQDVERLILWFEELRAGVSALLRSRQWRAGRVVGELHRRFLLRPRVPTALDYVDTVTQKFESWHKSHERSKDTPGRTGPREPSMPGEELAREIRGRIGPAPERADWPPVSIVVLNRNGLGHLERLFPGLRDRTDYSNFEVVLVDNGSTDGSVEYAKSFEAGFPVRLIENPNNTLFSTGNDQGAEVASNELLLFLNNDIEPFEPGWLKEQVDCLERSGASAAGALLLYPGGDDHRTASGYAIQHRGIRFRRDSTLGVVRAYNLGNDDALGEHLGVDARCPAATAACLLIRREAFDAVGGFTEGYRYGQEDVELGLKLSASGRRKVVSSGRAVLFHHEFGTQNVEGRDFMRINRMGNWRLLLERWGPQLHRELLLDRLDSTGFWSEGPAHVAITVAGHDTDGERDDRHAAHELGDALMRRGWRVTYVEQSEWYSLPEGADYLLVLLDSYDVSRVSGVTTVAWVRSRPDHWVRQPWFEEFDVVLAASDALAGTIGQTTNKTARLFPLATNPERFTRTLPNPVYEADYVFTGDHREASPSLVDHLDVAPKETFMVFGEGWEKVPRLTRYARGHLPYDQFPQVYSSARLLLDAAGYPNHGVVASRVFDALAAGTLVVTDRETGARELFDEDFPTYGTRQELREKLDLLLNDPPRRGALAERYREVVLREHTYGRRAEQLAELLHERVETLGFCVKVDVSDRGVAQFSDDLVRARAVRRQLERRGHPCITQILDEWDDFEGLKYDVVLHLKGPTPYVPKPSQFNVLWDGGHPESPTVRECDRYDLVVASEHRAGRLRSRTSTPVVVLEPATDPEVFFPDPEPVHRCELVFVGDSHEGGGRVLRDLFPTDRDLAVWGEGWEGLIGDKHIVGGGLTEDQARKVYSSASAVLVGHRDGVWEPGVVSSRVYDALACGALVISDGPPELDERFGDAVVTYDSPEELRRLVEHYLASPEEREEKGRRGREMVLAHHALEHRVEKLRWCVVELVEESGFRTRVRPLVRTE